ncbi:MAG: hypothetical protein OQL19_08355 [Gammaproteobacteria bacterium]|nr:hypothetical protein [Gammaproteobacteria bacterium]
MYQSKFQTSIIYLIIIGGMLISGCAEKKTDEALIQEQIEVLQTAIETHDRGLFMGVIDKEYRDQLNNTPKTLQRMLMGFFLRYKELSVYVSATQINVQQIRADADSQVVVTGGKNLIPENARHYKVHSCWKKISGDWFLSCLEWE